MSKIFHKRQSFCSCQKLARGSALQHLEGHKARYNRAMDEKSVQLISKANNLFITRSAKQDECKIWRWREQKEEEARAKLGEALDDTLASSTYSSLNYFTHI